MNNLKKERLKYLLDIFTTNSIGPNEFEEMMEQLDHKEGEAILEDYIRETGADIEFGETKPPDWEFLWQKIKPVKTKIVPLYKKRWMQVAATFIVMLTIAGMLTWTNYNKTSAIDAVSTIKDNSTPDEILAGGNKAILLLDNGKIISLDESKTGLLAKQGNTQINQNNAGEIVYNAKGETNTAIGYNTLSTPNGGQFNLVLPDGSRVWLNAASSIRFPTAFTGNTRDVSITGEVYFEVVKISAKPFTVAHNDLKIKVLGTSFCINTYANEPTIKTTLVTGLVEVSKSGNMIKLGPGQQIQFNAANKATLIPEADIEEVLAWKNGIFNFDKADLETVMRQFERWYDISVEYPKGIPKQKFWGKIQRGLSLNDVLEILKETGVNFTIKNRAVIITP